MAENKEIREASVVVGRTIGVLVLLTGILLAAHLCAAESPGSNRIPSIFKPHSTPAESIYHLSLFVLGITSLIFLVVFSLLLYVVVKFRGGVADGGHEPAQVYGSTQIELAWTVIPILIVVVLFLATARVIHGIQDAPRPAGTMEVTAIGHQFWWEFRYAALGIVTANELHIPLSDPTHPTPTFVKLLLRVYVDSPEDFSAWARGQQQPANKDEKEAAGRQVFESTACLNCHAIAGTNGTGRFGPDLTHLMSRRTIAAGGAENTPENLRLWIQNPHAIKTGSLMPAMKLSDAELDALVLYLETLH